MKKEIPFSDLNDTEFAAFTSRISILPKKKIDEPIVFDKLKVFTKNEGSKYYRSDQLNDLGFKMPDQSTSVLYLNISSLPYHIDELTEFLITISPQISKW